MEALLPVAALLLPAAAQTDFMVAATPAPARPRRANRRTWRRSSPQPVWARRRWEVSGGSDMNLGRSRRRLCMGDGRTALEPWRGSSDRESAAVSGGGGLGRRMPGDEQRPLDTSDGGIFSESALLATPSGVFSNLCRDPSELICFSPSCIVVAAAEDRLLRSPCSPLPGNTSRPAKTAYACPQAPRRSCWVSEDAKPA